MPTPDRLPLWIRWLYNALLPVLLVVGFPGYLIKGLRRGDFFGSLSQRFGFYGAARQARLKSGTAPRLWVHAVSVGEVLVGAKLLRALLARSPGLDLVFSTTTATGYRLAEKELRDLATIIYHPVDLPWVAGRVVRLVRPRILILIEAEIWPNLVQAVKVRNGAVVLANARLSRRSERRFHSFRAVTRPLYGLLDRVAVQFPADRIRFARLGVPEDRIFCPGSIKYDDTVAAGDEAKIAALRGWLEVQGQGGDGPMLIGGSTHAGEEALIARVWLRLREEFPGLRLVLVPRHAERGRGVAKDLVSLGIRPLLRHRVVPDPTEDLSDLSAPVVLIANTTGELRAWYALASVVVVGKSLLGRGGQNPSEPIAVGVPAVVGPHMGNFTSLVEELRTAGGLLVLEDGDGQAMETLLHEPLRELLRNPSTGRHMVAAGQAVLAIHHGAASRTAGDFLSLLGNPPEVV